MGRSMKVVMMPAESMTLLPPAADKCQICAVAHEPDFPHNALSLFYQVKFKLENGRGADWRDAMAHCTDGMKEFWIAELAKKGVDVEAGEVSPSAVTK